jgi:hypothetical protein
MLVVVWGMQARRISPGAQPRTQQLLARALNVFRSRPVLRFSSSTRKAVNMGGVPAGLLM